MLRKFSILSLLLIIPYHSQSDYDFKSYVTIAAGITIGVKLGNIAFNTAEKKISQLNTFFQKPAEEKKPLSQLKEFFTKTDQTNIYQPKEIKESLDNVIGLDDAKVILQSILLQAKQNNLGGILPTSMILSGPSGIGKTMLVKAFAKQANCTLLKTTVANLVEVISKNKVNEFITTLKKCAPLVLLVEDIASVSQQTSILVNELIELIASDQDNNKPLFFVGTAQETCCLKSSLKLNRINYITELWYPHINDRIALLGMYLKNIKHDPTIDIKQLAKQTFRLTGYDIKSLINQAATIATTKQLNSITTTELYEARNNMLLGAHNKAYFQSDEDKLITAYHEAGHALACILLPINTCTFHLITTMQRTTSLGMIQLLSFNGHSGKQDMLNYIAISLGGRAAEELIFNIIGSGPQTDFEYATNMAQQMICKYGMTDVLGKQVLNKQYSCYSQKTLEKIDNAITQMLDDQYEVVMKLLKENRDKLDKLAHAVYEKETMYADEVYELLEITPPDHKGKIFR